MQDSEKRIIIGITGFAGSGKDLIARHLKERGFVYYSLSDILRDECNKRGIETNRDNLIAAGNELREKFGPGVLGELTLKKINKSSEDKATVVSIRNPVEVEKLRKESGFYLFFVDSPLEVRYKRIKGRGRAEDSVSFEKFKEQEEREKAGSKTGQQLLKVASMADFTISNTGTREELFKEVDGILVSL